jgi:hypothetical protein
VRAGSSTARGDRPASREPERAEERKCCSCSCSCAAAPRVCRVCFCVSVGLFAFALFVCFYGLYGGLNAGLDAAAGQRQRLLCDCDYTVRVVGLMLMCVGSGRGGAGGCVGEALRLRRVRVCACMCGCWRVCEREGAQVLAADRGGVDRDGRRAAPSEVRGVPVPVRPPRGARRRTAHVHGMFMGRLTLRR